MLADLLLVLGALALWHFVVEGILSPGQQMLNKVELVKTARHLESVKKQCAGEFDPKVYYAMRNAIEGLLHHMPAYNFWSIVTAEHRLQNDPSFSREVAARSELILGCQHPEIAEVRNRIGRTAGSALTWNSVGWAIYVVPVALAAAMYRKTQEAIKALQTLTEPQLAQLDVLSTVRGRT